MRLHFPRDIVILNIKTPTTAATTTYYYLHDCHSNSKAKITSTVQELMKEPHIQNKITDHISIKNHRKSPTTKVPQRAMGRKKESDRQQQTGVHLRGFY